jgi:CBS-domain-containing membrane protein
MDAIIAGLGAALGFAALHVVNDTILAPQGLSCLCPPLGAVAVLLFCLPSAPASQPKAVIGGHIISGLIGYAVVQSGIAYGEAIAVAGTIAAMTFFKVVHPPAGAYAFLYVNKNMGLKGLFAPGLVGGIVLIAAQKFVDYTVKPMLTGNKKKTS